MNRKELIKIVSNDTGIKKKKCQKAAESVFGLISDALINGNKVSINNFGKFEIQNNRSNIHTDGSFVNIDPPSNNVSFKKNSDYK